MSIFHCCRIEYIVYLANDWPFFQASLLDLSILNVFFTQQRRYRHLEVKCSNPNTVNIIFNLFVVYYNTWTVLKLNGS